MRWIEPKSVCLGLVGGLVLAMLIASARDPNPDPGDWRTRARRAPASEYFVTGDDEGRTAHLWWRDPREPLALRYISANASSD